MLSWGTPWYSPQIFAKGRLELSRRWPAGQGPEVAAGTWLCSMNAKYHHSKAACIPETGRERETGRLGAARNLWDYLRSKQVKVLRIPPGPVLGSPTSRKEPGPSPVWIPTRFLSPPLFLKGSSPIQMIEQAQRALIKTSTLICPGKRPGTSGSSRRGRN